MRQTVSPVARPARVEPRRQFVVVGEQSGVLMAERDDDRAGERREIDHEARLVVLAWYDERVGEHEPAFGVGVDDLDRLAGHRGEDVARPDGVAVRHVLDQADHADGVDLGLAARERMHEADDAGRAAHVALHVLHAGGRLDRNAAGIETDALADEGDGLGLLAPSRRANA